MACTSLFPPNQVGKEVHWPKLSCSHIDQKGLQKLSLYGENPSSLRQWQHAGHPNPDLKAQPACALVTLALSADYPPLGFPGNRVFRNRQWTCVSMFRMAVMQWREPKHEVWSIFFSPKKCVCNILKQTPLEWEGSHSYINEPKIASVYCPLGYFFAIG